MKLITIFFIFIWQQHQVFAQKRIDSLNVAKAKKVIQKNFNSKLDSANYIMYNLDDKYLIIEKRHNKYMLFFIKAETGLEDSLKINRNSKILKIAFDPNSCEKYAVNKDTLSKPKAHPHSKYIYYYLKNNGIVYCEFNLPAIYDVDVRNQTIYPIDDNVHKFFIKKMFSHWTY